MTQIASAVLAQEGAGPGGLISMALPFVLLIAVFYFMMIRPENKRKKEAEKMRSELMVGDEISTIGGLVGTICAIKEDTIVIETSADRVRVEFTKNAVAGKRAHPEESKK